jgi:alkaline phosphatase
MFHRVYGKQAVYETIEFSKAIEDAVNRVNIEETLIIATADHGHVLTFGGYAVRKFKKPNQSMNKFYFLNRIEVTTSLIWQVLLMIICHILHFRMPMEKAIQFILRKEKELIQEAWTNLQITFCSHQQLLKILKHMAEKMSEFGPQDHGLIYFKEHSNRT